jgi:hypothetical protein
MFLNDAPGMDGAMQIKPSFIKVMFKKPALKVFGMGVAKKVR